MRLRARFTCIRACQELATASLAGVPTCAEECRFVRVIGVLGPSRTQACVALVLARAALVSCRACVSIPPCLYPAQPADGHSLGQPLIQLPLRPGRE
jgi:hypothetical protein